MGDAIFEMYGISSWIWSDLRVGLGLGSSWEVLSCGRV